MTNRTTSRSQALRRLALVVPLEQENSALKTENACLRTELQHKQDFVGRLQLVVRQRNERIDKQAAMIDQLANSAGPWMRRRTG